MKDDNYLRAELIELLRRDETIFDFIESGSLDGLWYWDLENPDNEWMSPRFWLTLGYDPSTRAHRASEWQDLIHPRDLEVAQANFARHCEDPHHPYDQIVRYAHSDGSTVWVRCRGLAIRDDSGTPVRMLGAHNDVTALMEHENERFRIVVEASPAAMVMIDCQRRIALVNRRTEEMFGYTRSELIGAPIDTLVPERYRESHAGHVASFFCNPGARPMGAGRDLYGRHKSGREIPVEIGLTPIESPAGLSTLAHIIDIAERKQREDELRRSNAELEQFAYVASHDLQEPLRMVANYTELLAERYRGQLDERADRYIHYASDGARRMQQLVQDLLAYSRIGSQGRPLVAVDAARVARETVACLARLIREAGATVDIEDLPAVLGDDNQLRQLFQNLIGNALKFRGEQAPRVTVRAVAERGGWKFAVTDNGIGFEMRFADRIFQMFQRLHELGRYEGSGIGLAIARRIVERHGGRIWPESKPGVGTTFHFTLQRAP